MAARMSCDRDRDEGGRRAAENCAVARAMPPCTGSTAAEC